MSGLVLLAGCGGNPDVAPKVSWSYGAGNGDGVQYQGPAPKYSFSDGVGQDVPVKSGLTYTRQYGYGADGSSGTMVGMAPQPAQPPQQVAVPALNTVPQPAHAATHS